MLLLSLLVIALCALGIGHVFGDPTVYEHGKGGGE